MTIDTPIAADAVLTPPTALDRQAALHRWRATHDVSGVNGKSLVEAACVAEVRRDVNGPMFDPERFAALVAFIEELPF
jgi:hypothetical protein